MTALAISIPKRLPRTFCAFFLVCGAILGWRWVTVPTVDATSGLDLRPRRCGEAPSSLLIAVFGSAVRFENRLAIRQTWGTVASRADVELVFVVSGAAVERDRVAEEASSYGDLTDYGTHETVFATLRRLVECFTEVRFVFATWDDRFLNPFRLLNATSSEATEAAVAYGGASVARPGPSLLMTRGAVSRLSAVEGRPEPSGFEEVASIARLAGVDVVRQDGFDVTDAASLCVARDVYTLAPVSANSMRMLWWLVDDDRLAADCADNDLIEVNLK